MRLALLSFEQEMPCWLNRRKSTAVESERDGEGRQTDGQKGSKSKSKSAR